METFYFYERAKLHLSNKKLGCSEADFEKLDSKDKIGDERIALIHLLQRYRALTLPMIEVLTKRENDLLVDDLTALMEYGLIIKQFFQYMDEKEEAQSVTFYCASANLPKKVALPDKKNDFVWNQNLSIGEAMSILAFNQFHISLMKNVQKKYIQAQLQFFIRNDVIDGRYRLKGSKLHLGYSHLFVHAVRDIANRNDEIGGMLQRIKHACISDGEMVPWFILICENKLQCAYIEKKLKLNPDTRDLSVYYLLDTDFSYDENPLHSLQTFRFEDYNTKIKSEFYKIENWY